MEHRETYAHMVTHTRAPIHAHTCTHINMLTQSSHMYVCLRTCTPTHTHIRSNTCTQVNMLAHMLSSLCTCACTHMSHICLHPHSHTYRCTHVNILTQCSHMYMCLHTHAHTHAFMHIHTCCHTCTQVNRLAQYSHVYVHVLAHKCSHMCSHEHSHNTLTCTHTSMLTQCSHVYTCLHTHACTCARTHSHMLPTCTRARMHTRTHTCLNTCAHALIPTLTLHLGTVGGGSRPESLQDGPPCANALGTNTFPLPHPTQKLKCGICMYICGCVGVCKADEAGGEGIWAHWTRVPVTSLLSGHVQCPCPQAEMVT